MTIPFTAVAVSVVASGGVTAARAGMLALAACAGALAWIDWDVHRIPNRIIGPLALITLTGGLWTSVATGSWTPTLAAAGWAALTFLIVGGLALIARRSLGMGDAKLLTLIVAATSLTSPNTALLAVIIGFLTAGLAAAVLLIGQRDRNARLPMAPWLVLGALAGYTVLG